MVVYYYEVLSRHTMTIVMKPHQNLPSFLQNVFANTRFNPFNEI